MDGTDCTSQGDPTDTWTYTYDGDGVRVKEVYDIGGTDQYTKHYFAGGAYEVEVNHIPEPDVTTTKRYYSIAGMMVAMDNGYQAAMMAPTEILAQQHARSLRRLLEPAGVGVELLTAALPAAEQKLTRSRLLDGQAKP